MNVLKPSTNNCYFSLYDEDGFVENLSTLYGKALYKTYALCGNDFDNTVPEKDRKIYGSTENHGDKDRIYSCFPFGKYKEQSIKIICKRDPDYIRWFFENVDDDGQTKKWSETVVSAKAWMMYYNSRFSDMWKNPKPII